MLQKHRTRTSVDMYRAQRRGKKYIIWNKKGSMRNKGVKKMTNFVQQKK
jgi:hypothetical protein